MSCVVRRIDSSLRRPAEFKKTRVISDIYNDGYEMDFTTLKPVKTEIIDSEEVAYPSPSELNVASADDNFFEQDFHNASLKDLRALSSCSSTMQYMNHMPGDKLTIDTRIELIKH